jgi:hypothetical protein
LTYDVLSGQNDTMVSLANSTSYVVPGRRMHRLGYEAGVRFYYDLDDNTSIGLSYMGAFRRDYQEHTSMINFRYLFK